jgi:hypothetical protein
MGDLSHGVKRLIGNTIASVISALKGWMVTKCWHRRLLQDVMTAKRHRRAVENRTAAATVAGVAVKLGMLRRSSQASELEDRMLEDMMRRKSVAVKVGMLRRNSQASEL